MKLLLLAVLIFCAGGIVGHSIRHLRCCKKRDALLEEIDALLSEIKKEQEENERLMHQVEELHRSEMERSAKI